MTKTTLIALCFPAALLTSSASAQITKTLTFPMPACPIKATTVPSTTTTFMLPSSNPLGVASSVSGTVHVTDQTGATILAASDRVEAGLTQVAFSRTVTGLSHATGLVFLNPGCASRDTYGSNDCNWAWGDTISASYQSTLAEDLQAGSKLAVDFTIDNTTPVSFSCPVCGGSCSITIPDQLANSKSDEIWALMIELVRFSLLLIGM